MSEAIYGVTNPKEAVDKDNIQRFGSVIELDLEKEAYYRELHANVWEGVQAKIHECNMRNYNIYIAPIAGKKYLFSFFEYIGSDLEGDMGKFPQDEETLRWWKETDPCQKCLPGTPEGEQWLGLERVFFQA
jgi:L-rhamnose mutarotase